MMTNDDGNLVTAEAADNSSTSTTKATKRKPTTTNDTDVEIRDPIFQNMPPPALLIALSFLDFKDLTYFYNTHSDYRCFIQAHPQLWIMALNRTDERTFYRLVNTNPSVLIRHDGDRRNDLKDKNITDCITAKPLLVLVKQYYAQLAPHRHSAPIMIKFDPDSENPSKRQILGHPPLARDYSSRVSQLIFINDQIAASYWGAKVKIWDLNGKLKKTFNADLPLNLLNSVAAYGKRLASSSFDGSIYIWNLETSQCTTRSFGGGVSLSLTFISEHHLAVCYQNNIHILNLLTDRIEHTMTHAESYSSVRGLIYHPERNELISGAFDGSIKIWDPKTGEHIHTFQVKHREDASVFTLLPQNRFASGSSRSEGGKIYIWDLMTRQPIAEINVNTEVTSLVGLPGDFLAVGNQSNGQVDIYDLKLSADKIHYSVNTIKFKAHVGSLAYREGSLYVGLHNSEIHVMKFARAALISQDDMQGNNNNNSAFKLEKN